jgi:hypothetical protein
MTPNTENDALLSAIDVARLLNIHPVTLRKARSNGKISIPYIRIGGSIRYREVDVLSFIRANTHGNEA